MSYFSTCDFNDFRLLQYETDFVNFITCRGIIDKLAKLISLLLTGDMTSTIIFSLYDSDLCEEELPQTVKENVAPFWKYPTLKVLNWSCHYVNL